MSYNEQDLPNQEPLPDDRPLCRRCGHTVSWGQHEDSLGYCSTCELLVNDEFDPPEPRQPTHAEMDSMAREYESWLKSGPDGF